MATELPIKKYSRIPTVFNMPNLIEVQLDSFRRLKSEGLGDLFHEISPIESYNKGMKLYFPGRSPEAQQWGLKYWFETPKHSMEECVERDLTYSSPLYVSVLLAGPDIAQPQKSDIFLGDFPEMTEKVPSSSTGRNVLWFHSLSAHPVFTLKPRLTAPRATA